MTNRHYSENDIDLYVEDDQIRRHAARPNEAEHQARMVAEARAGWDR